MNTSQAQQITDLTSYTAVTGKRFRLTKDELARDLTRDDALAERLAESRGGPKSTLKGEHIQSRKQTQQKGPRPSTSRKGNISLTLRPQAGIDSDFFERIPSEDITLVLDEKWYGMFDRLAEHPYEGDVQRLLQHILDFGIGEVGVMMKFKEDIETYERPVRHSTGI